MTAATVYRVIMNILLPNFTEDQDIFTQQRKKNKNNQKIRKAPEHIINTPTFDFELIY